MTHRERFLATVLGEPVDRPPYWLHWGPWGTTWQRWRREGMPEPIGDFGQVRAMFGGEWVTHGVAVNCGPCPRLPHTVLEETADSVVFTDSWGIRRRNLKGRESMSEFLEFPVKGRADWERFRDERLVPDDPRRLEGPWREHARSAIEYGQAIQLGYYPDVGIFGSLRWPLGDEECLIAFLAEPDLVHEIMDHMTDVYLAVFEQVCREVRVDIIHIWEDMCGRQGPLIGPDHWRQFMGPCYRRIKAFADDHGIPVISVDTDGKPDLIVEPMMEAGVNYLFPLEVAAGVDVNDYRRRWPQLAVMGGIDKRALAHGPAAIDAELARIAPAIQTGRYIPELDHLIPDDVSWENFCHYACSLRELLGVEAPART